MMEQVKLVGIRTRSASAARDVARLVGFAAVALAAAAGSASANDILCDSGWQPANGEPVGCGDYAFLNVDNSEPYTAINLTNTNDSLNGQRYFCQVDGMSDHPNTGGTPLSHLQNSSMGIVSGHLTGTYDPALYFNDPVLPFDAHLTYVELRCATFDAPPGPTTTPPSAPGPG
jgi:hypothetical protein